MFYISSLKGNSMIMNLYLNQWSFARMFGTDFLFDASKTGIISVDLVMATKKSQIIKNDIASSEGICKIF